VTTHPDSLAPVFAALNNPGGASSDFDLNRDVVLPPVAWDLSRMPGQPKVRGEDLKSADLTIPHAQWVEDDAIAVSLATQAVAAHHGLGLEGYSRSDFRAPRGAEGPCFLEVNSMPGLQDEQSVLPWAARQAGIAYRDVLGSLVALSLHRLPPARLAVTAVGGFEDAYRRLRTRAASSKVLRLGDRDYRLLEPRVLAAC
jgi:hypothetical protein